MARYFRDMKKNKLYKLYSTMVLAVLAGIPSGYSQIQVGVKGGLNIAELLTSKNQDVYINGNDQSVKNFPRNDFNAGLLVSIPLNSKWSLQPEAVYSQQGATARPSYGYVVSASEQYKLGYVNIPVLLKYRSAVGLFAETGPQVGWLASAKVSETVVGVDDATNYNVKSQFKSVDLGWTAGVGYLTPIDVGIDIRYNRGLSSINNASASGIHSVPVESGHMRNSVVQIGLFYLIGKSGLQAPHKDGDL
jgi:hypothetical protein